LAFFTCLRAFIGLIYRTFLYQIKAFERQKIKKIIPFTWEQGLKKRARVDARHTGPTEA